MAPSVVMLDRFVSLCFEAEDGEAAENNNGAPADASTLRSLSYSAAVSFLGSLRPDALLLNPPKISTLKLCSPMPRRDAPQICPYAVVACADKSMLVLYGGNYSGPGSSGRGCYLIYDVAVSGGSTLTSTVPQLPLSMKLSCIGQGAVALRSHPPSSSYVLAELAVNPKHLFPCAELYLWRSESPEPQWEMQAVQLPPETSLALPDKHIFDVDTSFSFGDSSLCWFDLLRGIVMYQDQQDPQFRFIPLPDRCIEVDDTDYPYRPSMSEFRTASCVAGAIKLFALEGYLEGWDSSQFNFVIWTLSPDLRSWNMDNVFPLKDIWASDKYLALNIPQYTPVCPVLSPREDGVVFLIVNDVEVHNIAKDFGVVETNVDIKGQYVLALDMHNNKIISINGSCPVTSRVDLTPRLFATDFCAYLQGPKDRERNVETSKVEESEKRPKLC